MGKDLLEEFVSNGWLDYSVTEGFDPYFEPSWYADENPRDSDAWGVCDEVGVGCSERLGAWDF